MRCGNLITSWVRLKGQCHEIFCFRFFFMNHLPQAPEYNIRVISILFKNLQVKVHHRCQRHQWQICYRYQQHGQQILSPVLLVSLISVAVWLVPLEVLLTPLVHLDLRISLQIFEKIWDDRNGGLGEDDSWKKPEVKNLGPNFLHSKEMLPSKRIQDFSVYIIHEDVSILSGILVVQIVQFGENIDMTNLVDRFLNPDVVARSIMFSTGVVITSIFLFFLLSVSLKVLSSEMDPVEIRLIR